MIVKHLTRHLFPICFTSVLAFHFSSLLTEVTAEPIFWTEKAGDQLPLVNLPSFAPVVEKVDATIVNVSGSSDPKQDKKRKEKEMEQKKGPSNRDPFMNPDEFFERFFGNQMPDRQVQPRRVLGSGFIISKDGYILTNNHVINGVDKIEVTLISSEKKFGKDNKIPATLIGKDPATDVALLKVSVGFELPVLPLGDSSKIMKGEWAMAFGNPFGLDHSVSAGIISAVGREITQNENRRFDDFIQTDAAINFGNSGGPLVNLKGEAIGINTAITAEGSGIGFAVPINMVKDIILQLKSTGTVSRGYLGVLIQDVNEEMKEALGLPSAKGVLVNDIVAGGPAAKSELRRGDIILRVNGEEVNDSRSLQKSVAKTKPGSEARLEILRDKKPMTLKAKVGDLSDTSKPEKSSNEEDPSDKLGLMIGMASDGSGVQIQGVEPGSVAEDAGLLPGDIIRKIDRKDIFKIDDYKKILGSLKSKSTVLFDLERGKSKLFIAFKLP